MESATARRRLLVITDFSDFGGNRKKRLRFLAERGAGAAEAAVVIGGSFEYGLRRLTDAGMKPECVHGFKTQREAAAFLRRELRDGDLVFLKGRTTDHAARMFFAQVGEVACWKEYCPKRMLCDICWELGITAEQERRAVPVPAGQGLPAAAAQRVPPLPAQDS